MRQQSVQGLRQLMMGFDQVSGRGDAVPNAVVFGMPRHVLSLENQLTEAAQPVNCMMMMPTQSSAFGVPGMNLGPALSKMGFVPPNAFGNSCFGSGSSSSGAQCQSHGHPGGGSYPWWEVDSAKDDEKQKPMIESSYHLRMRLRQALLGC